MTPADLVAETLTSAHDYDPAAYAALTELIDKLEGTPCKTK